MITFRSGGEDTVAQLSSGHTSDASSFSSFSSFSASTPTGRRALKGKRNMSATYIFINVRRISPYT
ncbi:hypothetical protein E2C01_002338 [Portunus trituberculatus]|uniref:Uncharacterized protein n=1 Tax=Portunus trituberculatus TaxID=210409 RepID=A0A5B7CJN6_PORTR|nr:hypothetical protein [Portunus trituberculatus]